MVWGKVQSKIKDRNIFFTIIFLGLIFGVLKSIIVSSNSLNISIIVVLSILYLVGGYVSWYIVVDNKNEGSYTALVGAFVAFIFSISFATYEGNITDLTYTSIQVEVLLLTIGVPLVFNTALRDENAYKHYLAMQLLKYFIIFSLFITILLLFELMIFGDNVSGTHIYLGLLLIDDRLLFSVSMFLFIFSIFVFTHIIFDLIDIYLISKVVLKDKFKQLINDGNINSLNKFCDKFNEYEIIEIMDEAIREEVEPDNSWIDGILHLIKKYNFKNREYGDKYHISTTIKLLCNNIGDLSGDSAEKLKSHLNCSKQRKQI